MRHQPKKVVAPMPVQYPGYEACQYDQSRDAACYVIGHVTACEVPASVVPQPSADERHLGALIDAA
jgi:hypothetical protein